MMYTNPEPSSKSLEEARETILNLFDQAVISFDKSNLPLLMNELHSQLKEIRGLVLDDQWRRLAASAQQHPIFKLMQLSPFVNYGFRKPRGYPGDATLIDFIYREILPDQIVTEESEVSRSLDEAWLSTPTAEAVRRRRDYFSAEIRSLAERKPTATILAVACGHFRELKNCRDLLTEKDLKIVGVDQDTGSLDCIRETYPDACVLNLVPASAMSFMVLENDLGLFDLIYAAGLYDYLDQPVARRLTKCLFDMLEPGGTLIVPNFISSAAYVAAMEVFMDWWLIYRDEYQIRDFATEISSADVMAVSYFEDMGEIGYLKIIKTQ